jgi:outer membrane protein assembly factor BamB
MPTAQTRTIADLVYVAFNKHVVALDRYTGEIVWKWAAPKGGGYTALLVDGDRLIVSAYGYMYCLDPLFGQEVWNNPLQGMGIGVPCLASANGTSTSQAMMSSAAAALVQQQDATVAAAV